MMHWWVARDGRRIEVSVERIGEAFEVTVDGRRRRVEMVDLGRGLAALLCPTGHTYAVATQKVARNRWRMSFGQMEFRVDLHEPLEREVAAVGGAAGGRQEIRAPIPGKVVGVAVESGAEVTAGQSLLVLEAMKMENQIVAEADGTVEDVLVSPGTTVEGGQLLLVLR